MNKKLKAIALCSPLIIILVCTFGIALTLSILAFGTAMVLFVIGLDSLLG